jgi:hypothetical protein
VAGLNRNSHRIEVDILPAPFGDARPAAPITGTPTFGFFGYSKSEKGFQLLPPAIEICRAQGLGVLFGVQF